MPNHDKSGPFGAGAMTGKRMGSCSGARGLFLDYNRGHGLGLRRGRGTSRGCCPNIGWGRGLGWFAVGYGTGGRTTAAVEIHNALEERKIALQAELDKIETLLTKATTENLADPRTSGQN